MRARASSPEPTPQGAPLGNGSVLVAFLTAVNPGALRESVRFARRMRSGRDFGLMACGSNRPLRPQAVPLARARYPLM